jgi:hypothetical protein
LRILRATLTDHRRHDVRFQLPDEAFAMDAEERTRRVLEAPGEVGFVSVRDVGEFIRVLLPVKLDDGELVFGVWVRVSKAVAADAWQKWFSDAYGSLELRGELANALAPWGAAIRGADVVARVRAENERPYVLESGHPLLARILTETWPSAELLAAMPRQHHTLPSD